MLRSVFLFGLLYLWQAQLVGASVKAIPRLDNIRIDGINKEWGTKGYHAAVLLPAEQELKPAWDMDASISLAWDEQGLLVWAHVRDDVAIEAADSTQLYRGDALELYFATDSKIKNLCQWILAPGRDSQHSKSRVAFYDYRSDVNLKKNSLPLEYVRVCQDDWCNIEIRLPWKNLGLDPKLGLNFKFQLYMNDADKRGANANYKAAWFPATDSYRNIESMYTLKLLENTNDSEQFSTLSSPDFAKSKMKVIVIAQKNLIGKSVSIRNANTDLAKGLLQADSMERASVTLLIPPSKDSSEYDTLKLCLDTGSCQLLRLKEPSSLGKLLSKGPEKIKSIRQKFLMDIPWEDGSSLPKVLQRHRGLVAFSLAVLNGEVLFDLEEINRILTDFTALIDSLDKNIDYLDYKRNSFWSAYYSQVDGSGQPFVVTVPNQLDKKISYPLLIQLHGSQGRPTPKSDAISNSDYIRAEAWGRGDLSYQGLGENDVLQVIEYMRKWYPIDSNRIYIAGGSMGGGGTWYVASRNPSIFAGAIPNYGFGAELPLVNLLNVPVFNQHGRKDWSVPLDLSRIMVQQLQKLGSPILHLEHPENAHNNKGFFPSQPFIMTHSRNPSPRNIRFESHSLSKGEHYYLKIHQFENPHNLASVTSTIINTDIAGICLGLKNISVLQIDLSELLERYRGKDSSKFLIQAGYSLHTIKSPFPSSIYLIQSDTGWILQKYWKPKKEPLRPYQAGAAHQLYEGEPLLIVYGTQGTQLSRQILLESAKQAALSGDGWNEMAIGKIPVVADIDVKEDQIKNCNLILLGNQNENKVTAKIFKRFPFKLVGDSVLEVAGRKLSIKNAGLRFVYPNPLSEKKLVFLIFAYKTDLESKEWYKDVAQNSAGGNSITRSGDAADLLIQNYDGAIRSSLQFSHRWKWNIVPTSKITPKAEYAPILSYRKMGAECFRRHVHADFGWNWSAKNDSVRVFDPQYYTFSDQSIQQGDREIISAEFSGRQLLEMDSLWLFKNEIVMSPILDSSQISLRKTYRIAMPSDIIWALKNSKQNLVNLQVHPPMSMLNIRDELFRR